MQTLDRDCYPIEFDPSAEVDNDPDSNPDPEKVCRANATRIAISILVEPYPQRTTA